MIGRAHAHGPCACAHPIFILCDSKALKNGRDRGRAGAIPRTPVADLFGVSFMVALLARPLAIGLSDMIGASEALLAGPRRPPDFFLYGRLSWSEVTGINASVLLAVECVLEASSYDMGAV